MYSKYADAFQQFYAFAEARSAAPFWVGFWVARVNAWCGQCGCGVFRDAAFLLRSHVVVSVVVDKRRPRRSPALPGLGRPEPRR